MHKTDADYTDESKGDALPKYAIVKDHITNYAYYGDTDLYTYTIPENITQIGDFAFARSNLNSINIPKGVNTIGYAAFYHCDNLKEISIPDSITWIEPSAFSHTGWLDAWASNPATDDFLIVGDNILIAYKGNQKYVEIPDGVETIAPACFLGHSEIMGINIPDSVTIIGEEAFKDCTSLQEVHGGENLVKIQDRAFKNTNLKEITIHKYVEKIGVGAFNCNSASNKTVIFKSDNLPGISYTETTSRLNNKLLEPVFDGSWTAVLNSEETQLTNTLFDNNYLGFVGDIATRDNNGNLNTFASKKAVTSSKNDIIINSDISEWSSEQVSADLDFSGEYHLKIKEKSQTAMEEAFKRIYGNAVPAMKVFEMTLMDYTDTVELTRLGNTPLKVTVPLPAEIKGNTVHAVVLDEDGQLEKLASSLEEKNGKTYVKFSTTHLSDFAIYAMGENGTVQIENGQAVTTVSGKKDYSPNTGDNSIHPKWFIAAGISAIAIAFITYKPKRKKRK
ncbi:MAG: leucine-rich repeat domain-containing protein [Prevotella sp.]|nr:leucine-rich repeat domain-containing protein [Prevotella sp.]